MENVRGMHYVNIKCQKSKACAAQKYFLPGSAVKEKHLTAEPKSCIVYQND